MKSLLTRFFSMVVLAGFIVSCMGDPNIESAKLNVNRGDYEQVIRDANAALENNPENPQAYYYLGYATMMLTREKPIEERTEGYEQTRAYFKKSLELFETTGRSSTEKQLIPVQVDDAWRYEMQRAATLYDRLEEPPTEESLARLVYPLRNAFTVLPDSISPLFNLTDIYSRLGRYDEAIETLNIAIDGVAPEPDLYITLVSLHQLNGDEEAALAVLQDAREMFAGSIEVAEALADVYFNMGDRVNSLSVISDLIDMDPENWRYHLGYGSRVYTIVEELRAERRQYDNALSDASRQLTAERRKARPDASLVSSLQETVNSAQAEIDRINEEIEGFDLEAEEALQQANTILGNEIEALKSRIGSEGATDDRNARLAELNRSYVLINNTLGLVHLNRAQDFITLFRRYDDMGDYETADSLVEPMQERLRISMEFYERAVEIDDQHMDSWNALLQIYTRLDMPEKVLEAQQKMGIAPN